LDSRCKAGLDAGRLYWYAGCRLATGNSVVFAATAWRIASDGSPFCANHALARR
jgi:hypothetical protein